MTLDASRRHPARPILAASVAVFRDDRILLAKRHHPPSAGCFSLPGGLVEVGEMLHDAALRELWEETGVRATIGGFTGHVEVIGRDDEGRVERHFVVASFWGDWVAGEAVAAQETSRVVWARPDQLGRLRLTPDLQPLLDRAVAERSRRS